MSHVLYVIQEPGEKMQQVGQPAVGSFVSPAGACRPWESAQAAEARANELVRDGAFAAIVNERVDTGEFQGQQVQVYSTFRGQPKPARRRPVATSVAGHSLGAAGDDRGRRRSKGRKE